MPTYQYACTQPDCGNRFELVQSFTDPSASECPVCNGAVRKVYGSVGVVFKGSGFYRTDSRSSGASEVKAEAKSEKKADSTSSAKTESKADSKPAKTESSTSSPARVAASP